MIIKRCFYYVLLAGIAASCGGNKNLAQSSTKAATDTLIQNINNSKADTGFINPQLTKLAKENDFLIAFATLNYAWTRKANYEVLACKNNVWTLYSYQTKLYSSSGSTILPITSTGIAISSAEKIKRLYAASQLWKIKGDEKDKFCDNKKDCNITDENTWTVTVATPQTIHSTTYYAPEFFEQCCPGNPYRQQFTAIAKAIQKLANSNDSM